MSGPTVTRGEFSLAQVDVSAARGVDGKLYLSLVNTDPDRPAHVTTNLTGGREGADSHRPDHGSPQHLRGA